MNKHIAEIKKDICALNYAVSKLKSEQQDQKFNAYDGVKKLINVIKEFKIKHNEVEYVFSNWNHFFTHEVMQTYIDRDLS